MVGIEFDGELYVGAAGLRTMGRVGVDGVAHWDGRNWHAAGSLGATRLDRFVVVDDQLVAIGHFPLAREGHQRFRTWDGQRWKDGPDSIEGSIRGAAAYRGQLYLAGSFSDASDNDVLGRVVGWDGHEWTAIGSDIGGRPDQGEARVLLEYEGRLVVIGDFTSMGGVDVPGIAAWDGRAWGQLTDAGGSPVSVDSPDWSVATVTHEALYVGGVERQVDGTTRVRIATLSAGSWAVATLEPTFANVRTLLWAGGRLFAEMTLSGFPPENRWMRLDGDTWVIDQPMDAAYVNGSIVNYRDCPTLLNGFRNPLGIRVPCPVVLQDSRWRILDDDPDRPQGMNPLVFDVSSLTDGEFLIAGSPRRVDRVGQSWTRTLGALIDQDVPVFTETVERLHSIGGSIFATGGYAVQSWDGEKLVRVGNPLTRPAFTLLDDDGPLLVSSGGTNGQDLLRYNGTDWVPTGGALRPFGTPDSYGVPGYEEMVSFRGTQIVFGDYATATTNDVVLGPVVGRGNRWTAWDPPVEAYRMEFTKYDDALLVTQRTLNDFELGPVGLWITDGRRSIALPLPNENHPNTGWSLVGTTRDAVFAARHQLESASVVAPRTSQLLVLTRNGWKDIATFSGSTQGPIVWRMAATADRLAFVGAFLAVDGVVSRDFAIMQTPVDLRGRPLRSPRAEELLTGRRVDEPTVSIRLETSADTESSDVETVVRMVAVPRVGRAFAPLLDIAQLEATLQYDAASAEVISVRPPQASEGWTVDATLAPGSVKLVARGSDALPLGREPVLLAELVFRPLAAADSVHVEWSSALAAGSDLRPLLLDPIGGEIGFVACDANDLVDDDCSEIADVVFVLRAAIGLMPPPHRAACACDVDGDGALGVGDAIRLLARLVGLSVVRQAVEREATLSTAGNGRAVQLQFQGPGAFEGSLRVEGEAARFTAATFPSGSDLAAARVDGRNVHFAILIGDASTQTLECSLTDEAAAVRASEIRFFGWDGRPARVSVRPSELVFDNAPTDGMVKITLGAAPNPMNPRTELQYIVSEAGPVTLQVFDSTGRRVRSFPTEVRTVGTYVQPWDGRDDRGHSVASGVYLVRLEARGVTRAIRITVLK